MVKAKGQCYEKAAKAIIQGLDIPALRLCHGQPVGQGPIEGIKHGHAWLELGDIVIDPSTGGVFRTEQYYRIGQIKNKEVKRYTRLEAIRMLVQTEHYGPWGK